MKARVLSAILSVVGLLMLIGGTIYFIIGYGQAQSAVAGLEVKEEIDAAVQPFISGMLIWVVGNYVLCTFVNGIAAMSYAARTNVFKGDTLFFIKLGLAFLPLILIGVYFLITLSLK